MKGKEFLNAKLTPFDAELCRMVESLTGKPCEPQWWNLTQYRIIVDYSIRPEPDFVSAVIDAIAGRAGQRFVDVKDKPEEYKCGMFASVFRLPSYFKTEKAMREKAKEILRIVGLEEERNNLLK